MKRSVVFIIGFALFVATLPPSIMAQAPPVRITVTEIVADGHIRGEIRGMNPADHKRYKVLIYVKTDQWYIHPYAEQGEGQSWASIQPDGKWEIGTVKRQFKAKSLAALVVKMDHLEPNRIENVHDIPHLAIEIMDLKEKGHYGKL